MTITQSEIDDLRAKLEKAVRGPWHDEGTTPRVPEEREIVASNTMIALVYSNDGADEPEYLPGRANAALIVAAINALPDLLDLASTAIAAREEATSWQPIESAPRDGTRILGATASGTAEVIFWAGPHGWFNQSAEISTWLAWPPTHWMPLPSTPEPK